MSENGNGVKIKIGVSVGITAILIWLLGISFSAGSLREKVQSLDKRTLSIPLMAQDIATIKTDIKWIIDKIK